MRSIVACADAADHAAARRLFEEYAASLAIDLCFQGFAAELEQLPAIYGPPGGTLLLARDGDEPIGCVAVRALDRERCELKRLYVRPEHRGHGLGHALNTHAIAAARALGYTRMMLDTLPEMTAAQQLYRSLGFVTAAPYNDNPVSGVLFLALELGQSE